jgi:hypothetical protein
VAGELREIALLRIPQLFWHLDHHSGYDASDAAGDSAGESPDTSRVVSAGTRRNPG